MYNFLLQCLDQSLEEIFSWAWQQNTFQTLAMDCIVFAFLHMVIKHPGQHHYELLHLWTVRPKISQLPSFSQIFHGKTFTRTHTDPQKDGYLSTNTDLILDLVAEGQAQGVFCDRAKFHSRSRQSCRRREEYEWVLRGLLTTGKTMHWS